MFGPEASGLSNDDLSLSNFVLQIPTSRKFKSLNLSHSLTVICYEIFKSINFNKFEKNAKNIKISSKSKISSFVLHLKKDQRDRARRLAEKERKAAREADLESMGVLQKRIMC